MSGNSLLTRFKNAWNVFTESDRLVKIEAGPQATGYSRSSFWFPLSQDSVVSKIYMQIATDVAAVSIRHVRVDESDRYVGEVESGLNECLGLKANIDQTCRAFIQDLVLTMFANGAAAVVPVDTDVSPNSTAGFDIKTMRVGEIVSWYARHVRLRVYNDRSGRREEITLPKERVAVVLNPLSEVMNRPNSDLNRLLEKIRILDEIQGRQASGKLDIIVQLPYTVRSDVQQDRAAKRIENLESQLANSQHGIAWFDSTEKITQLNRPAENTLVEQIEYLTKQVYNALGLTEEIVKGTATEEQQLQYFNRTVRPILDELCTSMTASFLSVKARALGQKIAYFRDPFEAIPMSVFAATATGFISSQVLTSNEVRAVLGYPPSEEAHADMLMNPNTNSLPTPEQLPQGGEDEPLDTDEGPEIEYM